MHPEPGPRFKHYELLEMIGKGGMGEVYRATDTRLSRDVAIKTSATQFGERFTREARVIASLNHPNICTLFDVGPDYLVMELVEGTTLAERIAEGPLKLEDATAIMQQVADALEYAHEKGVVHRDLKPANIKLRPDGVAKVLDFGLAKMSDAGPRSNASSLTTVDTQAGMVMGTPAYMSPEQAMGKPVDKRADVWAFGVVFYELLTGRRLHHGDSLQEVTASVLKDEPDLTQVPAQARRLLKRCLEKDPNKRLRHVGDVMALLDEPPSGTGLAPSQAASGERQWRWRAAAAFVLAGSALAVWALWKPAAVGLPSVSFEVGAPEGTTLLEAALGRELEVRIWYVGLRDANLHIQRVRSRAARGGHDIPESKIRSRYDTSRLNLVRLFPRLTELRLYDNSKDADPKAGKTPKPTLLLHLMRGRIKTSCNLTRTPDWAKPIMAAAMKL